MGEVRALADRFTSAYFDLDPIEATFSGSTAHDDQLTDYSPEGIAARRDLLSRTRRELPGLVPEDEPDRWCAALLADWVDARIALIDAGEELRKLSNMMSPAQSIRDVFDLADTASDEGWEQAAARLERVPSAYDGLRRALDAGRRQGIFAAPRQAEVTVGQLRRWAGLDGDEPWFAGFVRPAPEALAPRLGRAASAATESLVSFTGWLTEHYLPAADGTPDAVGPERYALAARAHGLGTPDLAEAYGWGWEELQRIEADMAETARAIVPGASLPEVMSHLNHRGEVVEGAEEMRQWLQDLTDRTIDELGRTHFDLAPELRRCDVRLAPPGAASAPYYGGPSEDFSRPGTTWLPTLGHTRFPTWEQVSTWYHEAVPGHHLQIAQWVLLGPTLSRFQTGLGGGSANMEGWALYAERLMDELGYLTNPAYRLGYLVGQRLRATRVVVDLGMHLSLPMPAGQDIAPGEAMTPERGRRFLLAHGTSDPEDMYSEWVRYLGWPAQAIGYKLGERVWLAGREAAQRAAAAEGRTFDLKRWHMAALSTGALGLDDLAAVLARLG